ncbi:MAG: membrane protein insertase YidC [Bacteroidales bacterium]|nr:membrane protein insertase YidC [Bacteroidales bacterium]
MNNKNTLIGFILIAAILFGWMYFMTPSKEQLAEQQRIQDSIRRARMEEMAMDSLRQMQKQQQTAALAQLADSVAVADKDSTTIAQQKQAIMRDKYGVFANASEGQEQTFTVENKLQRLTFSTKGGFLKQVELKDYKTYDSLPLVSFDPETALFDLSFFAQNRIVNTSQFYFQPYLNGQPYSGGDITVREGDSLVLTMRLATDDANKHMDFVYTIHDDNYMLGFDILTVGLKDLLATNANYMTIDWDVDLMKQEKSADRFAGETVYYRSLTDRDVDHLNEQKDSEQIVHTKLKWISFKQRFFCNVIVAKDSFENAKMAVQTRKSSNPRYFKSMSANIEVPINVNAENNHVPMQLYFGPNHFKTLRSYGLGLQDQINLGSFFLIRWINYGVIKVFNWLQPLGEKWNYGIVILILTILIKTLLFPLAFKSYKSSAITRVLKPEMEAINAKYPKEEDAMKKQQAIMNLQRQAGASPASGCLPALLQFPILIAIFRFFPASIELRQQPFLWADDLSTYDAIVTFPKFLGMDHLSLFTILMTITTLIYTWVNNKQMDYSSNPQMKPMKWMMYLMPIMFFAIFNNYSSGLSYYYMLVNIITFIQMFIFRRMIDEDKVRATIEENKKKPQKKSNFQKRLEEAQKQQAKLQQQQKRR